VSGQDGGEDLGGMGDGLGGDGSGSNGGGEDSCSTTPSSCGEWATISGILRDAAAGKGNFGLGEATEEVAEWPRRPARHGWGRGIRWRATARHS
jgi:hypothetical protein